jgi:hypothetical protein
VHAREGAALGEQHALPDVERDDNWAAQADEVVVLASIFGDDFRGAVCLQRATGEAERGPLTFEVAVHVQPGVCVDLVLQNGSTVRSLVRVRVLAGRRRPLAESSSSGAGAF